MDALEAKGVVLRQRRELAPNLHKTTHAWRQWQLAVVPLTPGSA
jgi:hypothetical protein